MDNAMLIRANILHGIQSVHAVVDPARIEERVHRVIRKNPDDIRAYSFLTGKNLGIMSLRHVDALARKRAKEEEAANAKQAHEETKARLRSEFMAAAVRAAKVSSNNVNEAVIIYTNQMTTPQAMAHLRIKRDALYQRCRRGLTAILAEASEELQHYFRGQGKTRRQDLFM